jgi:hypothetical protein
MQNEENTVTARDRLVNAAKEFEQALNEYRKHVVIDVRKTECSTINESRVLYQINITESEHIYP